MMSEETRTWLRRLLGAGFTIAAGALADEGEEGAATLLDRLGPGLVEQMLEGMIDESVDLRLGNAATAGGVVDYGE